MRKSSDKEADKKKIERKANKKNLTRTALTITIFFLVCNTSEFIWWLCKIAQGSSFDPPPIFTFLGDFSQTLNSSCNIFIYGVMSKRFRDTFLENFAFLFCKKKVPTKFPWILSGRIRLLNLPGTNLPLMLQRILLPYGIMIPKWSLSKVFWMI